MTFSCGRGVGSAPNFSQLVRHPIVGVPPALCRMSCPEVRGALAEGTLTSKYRENIAFLTPALQDAVPPARLACTRNGDPAPTASVGGHSANASTRYALTLGLERSRKAIDLRAKKPKTLLSEEPALFPRPGVPVAGRTKEP